MPLEIDLSHRTAIVTGAGRGIGREIALQFARAGADVVAAARTRSEIEETAALAEEHGVDAAAVETDLADPASIDALVDEAIDALSVPDVLVNNAGVNLRGGMLDRSIDDVDTMIAVNFRGTFLLSQRFAREVVAAPDVEDGRIVNVSSIYGHVGVPARTVYSGTKAGVVGLTRGLAAELAQDGITVNSVSPGRIAVDRIVDRQEDESDGAMVVENVPLGRLGEPEETAYVCAFLASDLASYVTGEDVLVDGGTAITAAPYPTRR